MPPDLAPHDITDDGVGYVELSRHPITCTSDIGSADEADIIVRQFCAAMPLTMRMSHLDHCVSRIVTLGSQEQMIGPDASTHITPMKHAQSGGNGAVDLFPGPSMEREPESPLIFTDTDPSVARTGDWSTPDPTGFRLCNTGPDAIGDGTGGRGHMAAVRAENAMRRLLAISARELLAAMKTGKLRTHRTLHSCGVTPSAVDAARGHSYAFSIPRFRFKQGG